MAEHVSSATDITIFPAPSLPQQPWWEALHSTVNTAFKSKNALIFPDSWTRLDGDPKLAAPKLAHELGPDGHIAVAFQGGQPVACGGVTPFRGLNWVDAVESDKSGHTPAEVTNGEITTAEEADHEASALRRALQTREWELCCFCVHPQHRRTGLSGAMLDALITLVKRKGGERLFANYVIEETGGYWPRLGFQVIPAAGGTLKKGWTHTPGNPGLLADIHFGMGVKPI